LHYLQLAWETVQSIYCSLSAYNFSRGDSKIAGAAAKIKKALAFLYQVIFVPEPPNSPSTI
jgi:hypothetical protein